MSLSCHHTLLGGPFNHALVRCSKLEYLHLHHCSFDGPIPVELIAKVNPGRMRELHLNNCRFWIDLAKGDEDEEDATKEAEGEAADGSKAAEERRLAPVRRRKASQRGGRSMPSSLARGVAKGKRRRTT